ncbi:hypothetical protein FMM05_17875 [Flavobacterium zepuense]|uniref:Uncharacterized protein n=1 Tax=Flavobacterium zepuense TaxID=2593302 RepID=A0A552UW00_9FLAO|nr:hypothetical protein [Flavobacterium zepuense]TRW22375.1 hypothetical protein FMM05_17875 [Flavobacterium zepuense]
MYNYDTPENAILSLEKAYSDKDLENVLNSKDFKTEAKLILEQSNFKDDISAELIDETARLGKLLLIKALQENGFPDFSNLKCEFYNLQRFRDNIYVIEEKITYPDDSVHTTRIFLTVTDDVWKVAVVEE